jgi:hypothetical protein
MSNVAKFLIVLNLILAGVFVGSAANFLGQKDFVQERLELQGKNLQLSLTNAQTEVANLTAKNRDLSNENTNLKEASAIATTAKSDTERQNAQLSQQNASLAANLSHATTALELLNGTLKANQETIKTLQDERAALTASRDTEHTARTAAEAMTATIQRQLDDETAARKATEAAVADAHTRIQSLEAENQAWISKFPDFKPGTAQPAITPGKVLAADNQMGLVVISLGEEDGVKAGFEYIVSRGNQYVASIKVTDVQAKQATAMVVKGMQKSPVQANDTVMNR